MAEDKVQTRSEEGELLLWPTIASAMDEAKKDLSIWKISWMDRDTGERIRLVRRPALTGFYGWIYEPLTLPRKNSSSERR